MTPDDIAWLEDYHIQTLPIMGNNLKIYNKIDLLSQ